MHWYQSALTPSSQQARYRHLPRKRTKHLQRHQSRGRSAERERGAAHDLERNPARRVLRAEDPQRVADQLGAIPHRCAALRDLGRRELLRGRWVRMRGCTGALDASSKTLHNFRARVAKRGCTPATECHSTGPLAEAGGLDDCQRAVFAGVVAVA